MKNFDEKSSRYALCFVLAFAVVMATPAFAERVMTSQTTKTVTTGAPVSRSSTTVAPNGDTNTVTTTSSPTSTRTTTTYTISDPDRTVFRTYLRTLPPVATPSHIVRRTYVIGQPLPTDVNFLPLPDTIVTQLQPVPADYYYVRDDNDILLVSRNDKNIVDVVDGDTLNK